MFRERLGAAEYGAARAEGESITLDQAMALMR
jgi:hypothetical protein